MSQPTFIAPASQSAPRKTLPAETYAARCYQMIMLGTHTEDYQGETKTTQKIWLGWEIPGELDTFGDSEEFQPYTMGKEYNFSMGEKANLRKDLESWRGVRFTDAEAFGFDVGKLLGAVCSLGWISYTKKDSSPGMKVGSITRLMKGIIVPPPINPIQALSFADFDYSLYEKLPKFLKEKIASSPEFKALQGPPLTYQTEPAQVAGFGNAPGDQSDDLPF